MLIAKVLDGQVVQVSEHKEMFPDVSFSTSGPNALFLTENSCLPANLWREHDHTTQHLVSCDPVIDGEWVYMMAVRELTAIELAARTAPPTVDAPIEVPTIATQDLSMLSTQSIIAIG